MISFYKKVMLLNKSKSSRLILLVVIFFFTFPFVFIWLFMRLFIPLIYIIYEKIYFQSRKFNELRLRIKDHIVNCNELNSHIENLKYLYTDFYKCDYGSANFVDSSKYTYKRKELNNKLYGENIYHCSRDVVGNAKQQPFKYLCKYFNINPNEETVEIFEDMLNNFSAAENGKQILLEEKKEIFKSIETDIPFLIKKFSIKKFEKELGFEEIDLNDSHFFKFVFHYTSSAGNSSYSTEILLDNDNIERLIKYLADIVSFRKTAQGQRQLMTQKLREKIKNRDNYNCKYCGVSIKDEPHLLLEIDHILPISKGGLTEETNLQTLCWKCNRHKSNK